eukprot:7461972-Pyramimonas_sp.AAC.1
MFRLVGPPSPPRRISWTLLRVDRAPSIPLGSSTPHPRPPLLLQPRAAAPGASSTPVGAAA